MKKSILFLILYLCTILIAAAQTDVNANIGEKGYILQINHFISNNLYLGAQLRDFDVNDLTLKRDGVLLVGVKPFKNNIMILSFNGGYSYNNNYLYSTNLDLRVKKAFYISLSYDNLNFITGGLKIRLSDLEKKCKCSWKN